MLRHTSLLGLSLVLSAWAVRADDPYPPASNKPANEAAAYQPPYYPFAPAAASIQFDKRMVLTGLLPAVYVENLCKVKYRVTTKSADCQKYIDQGLGYLYSYVWMEAARSFETALSYDPECAFGYLGLARAFDKWGKNSEANKALEKAKQLLPKAGHREQLLITSKLQEKGMLPGVGPDERKKKAAATLDELLTLYSDDEEGWFARAQINGGTEGAVYYKTLLLHNPVHPGAAHELVHFFENFKRPALGWPYAVAYMESTPKIAHAYHMQAHLAMRIGKWDRTCDWSVRALELEREYHRIQNVNPRDDFQFSHHLETCMTSLLHEGRYAEAHSIRTEAEKYGWSYQQNFLALAIAERDWEEALKLIQKNRKGDKSQLAYQMAMLYLEQGQLDKAKAELEVLQNLQKQRKSDKSAEVRFNTAEGWLLCQTGSGEAGLKLLQRAVDKTKDDYNHHAWGRGSSLMEIWGVAALQAGDIPAAEEAFQEALAHDAGSARAALGLYAMCNRLDRKEEAERYLKVAQRCWQRADSVVFEKTKDSMLSLSAKLPKRSVTVSADTSVNR